MFVLSQVLTACEYNSTQSVLLRVTQRLSVQKRGKSVRNSVFFVFPFFSFFQFFFRFFSFFLLSFFVEEKVRN